MRNSIGKVGLNAGVAKGQKFEKMGGKRSSVKFLTKDAEGVCQVMLKVKPENLDKFVEVLEGMAK